jgi:hypothetical protein
MESVRFSVETDYSPVSHMPRDDNRGRLQKIEQKLQAITVQRQNQIKDDAQETMTRRVLNLESRLTEEMREMEAQTRIVRE